MISDLPEGGLIERELIREGALFTKSSDMDIFGSFSVLLSHILQNQQTILQLQYINSRHFLSQTILELTCKVVYSLVSNRRGGWNSRGGWKKSQKLIAGGVGIIGGGWKKS